MIDAINVNITAGSGLASPKTGMEGEGSVMQPVRPKTPNACADHLETHKPNFFGEVNIGIDAKVGGGAGMGPLSTFPLAPHVNTEADWGGFNQAVQQRIVGSDAGKAGLFDGGNIWSKNDGKMEERAAVGWAMQKDPNVQYDADRKMFFVRDAAGQTKDVASLDEVTSVIRQHGGANQNNGAAFNAVGDFLKDKVANSALTSSTDESVQLGVLISAEGLNNGVRFHD